MIDVDRTIRQTDILLDRGDPVLFEGRSVDTTVELKIYEVELAARPGSMG
jgi:hypothetical protein